MLTAKGMYGLACLASILDDLGYLQSMTAFEAEMEGDGSNLPVMLGEAMRSLANALIAMSKEEAAELLAGAGAIPDVVAADNTASKPLSFIKSFAELRAKAGRALSATNAEHVAEIGKALDAMSRAHQGAQRARQVNDASRAPATTPPPANTSRRSSRPARSRSPTRTRRPTRTTSSPSQSRSASAAQQ